MYLHYPHQYYDMCNCVFSVVFTKVNISLNTYHRTKSWPTLVCMYQYMTPCITIGRYRIPSSWNTKCFQRVNIRLHNYTILVFEKSDNILVGLKMSKLVDYNSYCFKYVSRLACSLTIVILVLLLYHHLIVIMIMCLFGVVRSISIPLPYWRPGCSIIFWWVVRSH